jgi:hypothetical protein
MNKELKIKKWQKSDKGKLYMDKVCDNIHKKYGVYRCVIKNNVFTDALQDLELIGEQTLPQIIL